MTKEEAFLVGFLKAASEAGYSKQAAVEMFKSAIDVEGQPAAPQAPTVPLATPIAGAPMKAPSTAQGSLGNVKPTPGTNPNKFVAKGVSSPSNSSLSKGFAAVRSKMLG